MYQIKWDFTKTCFLHCKFCLNDEQRARMPADLTEEEMRSVVNNLVDHAHLISGISFLGGEPTARKDFAGVIRSFEGSRIGLTLVSNGIKWKQERYLELLDIPEVHNVVISLDSHIPEITDAMRGRGVHGHVVEALRRIVARKRERGLRFSITVNTVLNQASARHLKDYIAFCSELGVNELSLLQMLCEGGAKSCDDLSLSLEETDRVIRIIGEEYEKHRTLWQERDFVAKPKFAYPLVCDYALARFGLELPPIAHPCNAGFGFAYLNHRAELYPCDRFTPDYEKYEGNAPVRVSKSSLLDVSFADAVATPSFDRLHALVVARSTYRAVHPCSECRYLLHGCTPCPMGRRPGVPTQVTECSYYHEHADLAHTRRQPFAIGEEHEATTVSGRYRVASFVSEHEIDGRLYLHDNRDASHVVISPQGASLWRELKERGTIASRDDEAVRKFLGFLAGKGIVTPCSA